MLQVPDKALDDKPAESEAFPSSAEPPSPSVLDTPLPEDEDREEGAEWFEDDLIVVKNRRPASRICAEAGVTV